MIIQVTSYLSSVLKELEDKKEKKHVGCLSMQEWHIFTPAKFRSIQARSSGMEVLMKSRTVWITPHKTEHILQHACLSEAQDCTKVGHHTKIVKVTPKN